MFRETYRTASAILGTTPGTMLLTLEPAGLEVVFAELAAVSGPPDPVALAPIFVKYGLECFGPPLADDVD